MFLANVWISDNPTREFWAVGRNYGEKVFKTSGASQQLITITSCDLLLQTRPPVRINPAD